MHSSIYIIAGEEVNAYDCERRSACASMREEANAYDCEIRSMRERKCMRYHVSH
jgi:hypothetical protein